MSVSKGGVALSEGKESFLRFSLEESVWFQKGQEVAELLTVSLDPNITIHEKDQYVTIQGALQLSGEYKRNQTEGSGEEDFPTSPKFIHQVEERDEGITEFSHLFPVDITIPYNRIESIYDIDVEIESFDYVFPERSCMKLTADLKITGLKGDEQPIYNEEQQEEIELDIVYREQEEEEEKVAQQVENMIPPTNELFAPFEAEARKSSEKEEEEVSPISVEQITPTLQMNQAEIPDISFSAHRSEETPVHTENNQFVEEEQLVEYESPSFEEHESSSPTEVEVKKKKKKISKKQGISITEFLARKEEHEDVAKLKVCIVQNGDTLESLAERYDVSTQSLLKVNHLEVNQDIHEGQVLYIPGTVAFRA